MQTLSRLPIEMLDGIILVDVSLLGTSLVAKYSNGAITYSPLDAVVANASPTPDFYFDLKHRQSSIERGTTVTAKIEVKPTKGFKQSVKFRAVDPPAGLNISFEPAVTAKDTVMTVRCDSSARLGQCIVSIKATAREDAIVREFDLVLYVTPEGSGSSAGALPENPVPGQAAVLNSDFLSASDGVVPAGTPMQFTPNSGWVPSPSYTGSFGNWETIKTNSDVGLTIKHHEYTQTRQQTTRGRKWK